MADNQNLLDSVIQYPGSLASRALQGVANTARDEQGKTGDISRYILDKVSSNESTLEKLDKPYRKGVARPLSAFLQSVKDIGKDGLTPRETWDRAWQRSEAGITVGQASVGLVSRFIPGKQGADKLDWSNKKEVQDYFEKDNTAAERISGTIDAVTNFFADPFVIAGKGVKLARLTAMGVRGTELKTPLKFGRTNLAKLVEEADAAKAGKQNSASVVVDTIEANIGNYLKLESIPIIANSQNPTAVSRAMNEAYETGGREQLFEVLKAGLGDETAIKNIEAQDSILSEAILKTKNEISSIKRQLEGTPPTKPINNVPKLTPKQIKNLEANQEKLVAEKIKQEKELDALRTVVTKESEGGIVGKVGSELAWSRSRKLEYMRNKASEINGRGWFTDYDASVDSIGAAALHKFDSGAMSQTAFRALRTVGYFGRGYKTREIPAGSVTIAGEVGDFANKEFRARIISAAKEAGFSAAKQQEYYNEFSAIKTDSGRFQFLDRFEQEALTATLKRKVDTTGMSKEQLKTFNETIIHIAKDIGKSKREKLKQIVNEQNYVNVDHRSGDAYIVKDVQDSVTRLARRIAQTENKPVAISHITKAKDILTGVAQTRTQVPNIHYGVDFQKISEVINDDSTVIKAIAKLIKDDPSIKASDIKSVIDEASMPGKVDQPGALASTKETVTQLWHEQLKYNYENLQNYFWKPAVLLSLRYTSRNVLEGWARVLGSFADMATHNGYSLRTLVSGFDIPDMIASPLESAYKRTSQRVAYKGIFGIGGIKGREAEALAAKLENEAVIGRNFGIELTDGPETIVEKIAKRYKDEGEYFLKSAKDVLSASIEMSKVHFNLFDKYKGSPATTKISKQIAKIGNNVFNIQQVKDGPKISPKFLAAMQKGDYDLSYKIAINSDPEIILNTLEEITKKVTKASKDIEKLYNNSALNSAPKLKLRIERTQELLDLVLENADVTKMAFDSSNRIRIMKSYNDVLSVSKVPAEKILAFSRGRVKIGKGATIEQSMAKAMRYETVSAANSTSKAVLGARRNFLTKFSYVGRKQTTANPSDQFWAAAHAEYMNNILYGDDAGKFIIDLSVTPRDSNNPHVQANLKREVAKLEKKKKSDKEIEDFTESYLASRYSDDEIKASLLDWIKSSASNTWRSEKYLDLVEYRKGGLTDAQWSDITDTIFEEVHRYLPMEDFVGEGDDFLRQALIKGKFDDTYSSKIPMGYREPVYVNGEIRGDKSIKNLYKNAIGNLFHLLATAPEDFFVRHPFYNAVYKAEGERLAKQFAKQGADLSTRAKEIQNAAHAAALKAVNDRLYTVERHTNIGQLSRFIEPFYMARQNTAKFWIPAVVRNPEIAVRFVQAFSLPYKLGTVYDREDNYKVVNQVGHPWNTKGMVMAFDYPQWMKDKFFDGQSDALFEVPLAGFDVVFQGQPIGVPQIGSPIGNIFIGPIMRGMTGKPYDPAKFLEKHGIADLDTVIKYVQPYYESTRGASTAQQVVGAFGSGSVALESLIIAIGGSAGQFDNPKNGQKFYARYRSIEADKLAKLSQNDVRINATVLSQVREESLALAIKSFYVEAFTNGSPLVATTKYRTYYELFAEPKLRELRAKHGYELGTALFAEEIDSQQANYIANLISDGTTDNRFGFNSSEATLSGIYENQGLLNIADRIVADTSLIGALFNQGDFVEDRSDVASDILFNIRVNGKPIKYTSDEAFTAGEDLQVRAGNKDFYAGIEIIEQEAKNLGIRKGTKAYEEYYGEWKKNWTNTIAERYPMWGVRERTIRQDRVEKNLFAAQAIVSDSNYMNTVGNKNPVALAIAEYLRGRVKLQEELAYASAQSGYKTIEAQDNAYVAELRDNYVDALEKKYPGFQRVYEIYFNNDKLNDISIYQTGYGFGGTE